MEEHLSPLAITHLLQHTLRSLCVHENSHWVYAVFWRILPRNYPPPKWDGQAAYDRSRGNRRNWILVWEDGFCNFAASTAESEFQQPFQGLQPELFFKMSHEIYNYGEGLIGKVAADHSHKWIHNEPNDQEINFLSAWNNSADSHPRTWEAQFQSGIKTIALIAVREGVVQLGAVQKVIEDLSYVVLLRKKFSYIESIPGVLLPHPSSSVPLNHQTYGSPESWPFHQTLAPPLLPPPPEFYDHFNQSSPLKIITPSMSSLEALLSKLPSVIPPQQHPPSSSGYYESPPQSSQFVSSPRLPELMEKFAKEEMDENSRSECELGENGKKSSAEYRRRSMKYQHYQDLNVSSSRSYNGF